MFSSKEHNRGAVNRPSQLLPAMRDQPSLEKHTSRPLPPLPQACTTAASEKMSKPHPTASPTSLVRPNPQEMFPELGDLDEGWDLGFDASLDDEAPKEGLPTYEQSVGPEIIDELGREEEDEAGDGERGEGGGTLGRFGRWRGWVEKRAHERFADDGGAREERRAARRLLDTQPRPPSYDSSSRPSSLIPAESTSVPRAASVSELGGGYFRYDYGSKFIPHSFGRITSILSFLNGRLVLYGTTNGLRVLNVDLELNVVRPLWYNLPVWDMQLLSLSPAHAQGEREAAEGGGSEKTPRGSIALLCGGEESNGDGPKRGSGGEVRIYTLQSLISLARWAAIQPKSFKGLNLSPHSVPAVIKGKKGKGKETKRGSGSGSGADGGGEWNIDDPQASPDSSTADPDVNISMNNPLSSKLARIAQAWSRDYVALPTHPSNNNPSGRTDALGLTTYSHAESGRVYLAIATPTHIVVHVGLSSTAIEGNVEFRGWKVLSLPSTPGHLSFLRLSSGTQIAQPPPPMRRNSSVNQLSRADNSSLFEYDDYSSTYGVPPPESSPSNEYQPPPPPPPRMSTDAIPSLGLYVTFGSKACLIRISDSTVLDFKIMQDIKGDWGSMKRLVLPGGSEGEVYVLTKGKETCIFSAPFLLPAQENRPITRILWPETPLHVSVSLSHSSPTVDSLAHHQGGLTIRLASTSQTGNLHIRTLPFSSGAGKEERGARPFISFKIGSQAKVLEGEFLNEGAREKTLFVGYKRGERDWRLVKVQQA